jgi:hypothetical protein
MVYNYLEWHQFNDIWSYTHEDTSILKYNECFVLFFNTTVHFILLKC